MSEKYAKIVTELALHESTKFPGAGWHSVRHRLVDTEGRDLLDPAVWSEFKKVTCRQANDLGYALLGEEEPVARKVVYRQAETFEAALSIKRAAWEGGNECFVRRMPNGTFSTWEVWS